jgi:hypothetical protein
MLFSWCASGVDPGAARTLKKVAMVSAYDMLNSAIRFARTSERAKLTSISAYENSLLETHRRKGDGIKTL